MNISLAAKRGFARAFDFSGAMSRWPDEMDKSNGFEKDLEALRRDWDAIGEDFGRAEVKLRLANGSEVQRQ